MFHRHHRDRSDDKRFARHGREDDGERHGRHGRHGGFFGRHFKRGGGGRGLGRFFAHGDLRLVVLDLIAEKPRHGYEIIKAIEDRVAGAYSPSPGVIYPTLTYLEELNFVTVDATEDAGTKKLYTITAEGRSYLDANRQTLTDLHARMDDAGRAHGSGDAPQVVRAMENLKLALKLRLSRGPLNEEQITAVAAALDGAATSIEQLK